MLQNFENGIFVCCWLGKNHTIPARRRVLCRLPFPSGLGTMEAWVTPAGYTGRVLCFREHKKGCFCSAKQKTQNSSSQSTKSTKDVATRRNEMIMYE